MELDKYKSALIGDNEDKAIEASNFLANRLDDEILTFLIDLLDSNDELIRDMAAITLAKNPDIRVVEPLFNAILKSENENARGVLVNCLAYFEIDDHFVDVFKLYLFGNFKVSPFAFDLLNSKSFDIRQRTLKKASKALHHFSHNIGDEDEIGQEKKKEASIILKEIEELLAEDD